VDIFTDALIKSGSCEQVEVLSSIAPFRTLKKREETVNTYDLPCECGPARLTDWHIIYQALWATNYA